MIQKKLALFVLVATIIAFILPATEFLGIPTPSPQFEWNEQPFRPVGVNYYPRTHPWTGTWTQFNGTELAEDFAIIKSLGGNCVRTFIQWELVEPAPWIYNTTIIDRIVEFFEIASEADLAIMLSFFDFGPPSWAGLSDDDPMYTDPDLIAHQVAQLELIIPLINHTKAAFMWDLRNEPTSSVIPISQFVRWVENLTTTIRALGDNHYVVVGGGYGNFEDPRPYAALVDAVCMHFYGASKEPQRRRAFENYLQMFKQSGKPVIVQEFGWSSSGNVTESMQADYYRIMFNLFDQHEIAGVMPWCLWDYGPNFWSESEANFGLLRYDQTWKPAAHVFHDYATGQKQLAWNYWGWEALY
jgi:endo-1,4-beta-mannosidase